MQLQEETPAPRPVKFYDQDEDPLAGWPGFRLGRVKRKEEV